MTDTLPLEGRLDLTAVAALHEALVARQGGDVTVDLTGVTQMGALCLQCLIAAATAARARGHRLSLINIPDQVLSQCVAMGLSARAIEEGAK
ncbi:MAG: STAS domain-containing protein [Sulfitobacter sp.]|nr:STAS domain-containing protein [Sulfitobacter sp.]